VLIINSNNIYVKEKIITYTIHRRVIVIIAIWIIIMIIGSSRPDLVSSVNGQSKRSDLGSIGGTKPQLLPVVLIHGYAQDASVWKNWKEDFLIKDGIPFYPVTFNQSDDKCGSATDHARELTKLVQRIQNTTGSKQVNIVGYSKGGLDARVYLANGTKAVANLIMIGTSNAGAPLGEISSSCAPAIYDLGLGAAVDKANMNPNTKYYTIAGDWMPSIQGNPSIPGPDDGLVAISSVESQGYFKSLGHTLHRHEELVKAYDVYQLARGILLSR
jgi:pimeloyl-ACP methyl ester carboxylesterase